VRKYLTASLIACLVTTSLVGCGEPSQESQVSDQLETLLDKMSQLQYADAPIEGNELVYTLGKEVNGVKVPGSIRFEAAYLDQAKALLPLAQDIKDKGTPLQKQSANAIIGSIKTDEAAFLIDEADRSFLRGAKQVVDLRSKLAVLREIRDLNSAVAGDGSVVIETYRTGLRAGRYEVIGINAMQENANAAAQAASKASQDLASYNKQIEELKEKVAEYEALELKLSGEARSAQSSARFDKLDQATAAAKEAEQAQADAAKLEVDAWISERVAKLAEYKRQLLDGAADATTAGLIGKLSGLLQAAGEEANVPSSSDVYGDLAQLLADAKQTSGDDMMKSAAFLLAMSDYATATGAPNLDQRQQLAAALDKRVVNEIGVIGLLEIKIAQIQLERKLVADKLAEIAADRDDVISEFSAAFAERDAMIQAAGFDRMAQAIETLKEAEEAIKGSGRNVNLELMSAYTLHARALQQQSVSAKMYSTTLSAIAAAGPELLGSELHGMISGRVEDMNGLQGEAKAAVADLEAQASETISGLSTDAESAEGKVATRQLAIYQSLVANVQQGGGATPAPGTGDTTDSGPAAGGTDEALLGTWRQEIKDFGGQPLPEPINMDITFKADGVMEFKMAGPDGQAITAKGSYSVSDGKITTKSPPELGGEEEAGTYEITGTTLKMVSDADGEAIELTRVE
jgi:hypothetical protein